jgi:hypothetical protein
MFLFYHTDALPENLLYYVYSILLKGIKIKNSRTDKGK